MLLLPYENGIGFTRPCGTVWAWDYLNTKKFCNWIFFQSLISNAVSDFSVSVDDITSAGCDEAFSGPVFAPWAGAIRRRMNIKSEMFSTRDKDGNYIENEDGNEEPDDSYVSPSMNGFLNCLETVNTALSATAGPYFLDYTIDTPTMIDFVFASHIERMVASCAYWKGMNLRSAVEYPKLDAVQKWMDALEKHDYYLAFKSDYYTHVKDIPPQYGPSSDGVSRLSKITQYKSDIEGGSGAGSSNAWKLPLEDDDTLQPLYNGIPLPKPVLQSVNIECDNDGSYKTSGSKQEMKLACQLMAVWKLCGTFSFVVVLCVCVLCLLFTYVPSTSKNF
jgi:hypothetical protein